MHHSRQPPDSNPHKIRAEQFQFIYQHTLAIPDRQKTLAAPLPAEIFAAGEISLEAIRSFDEENAINVIANTFGDHTSLKSPNFGTVTFNPIDKVMELFERLLASEREKVELMKEILEKIK